MNVLGLCHWDCVTGTYRCLNVRNRLIDGTKEYSFGGVTLSFFFTKNEKLIVKYNKRTASK